MSDAPASSQRHLLLQNQSRRSTTTTTSASAAMSYPSLLYYSSSNLANNSKIPLCVEKTSLSTSLSRNAFPLLGLSTSLRETEAHPQNCATIVEQQASNENNQDNITMESQTHSPYFAN